MGTSSFKKTGWKYPGDDYTYQVDWTHDPRRPINTTFILGVVGTATDSAGNDATSLFVVGSNADGLYSQTRIHGGVEGETYLVKQVVTFDSGNPNESLEDYVWITVRRPGELS